MIHSCRKSDCVKVSAASRFAAGAVATLSHQSPPGFVPLRTKRGMARALDSIKTREETSSWGEKVIISWRAWPRCSQARQLRPEQGHRLQQPPKISPLTGLLKFLPSSDSIKAPWRMFSLQRTAARREGYERPPGGTFNPKRDLLLLPWNTFTPLCWVDSLTTKPHSGNPAGPCCDVTSLSLTDAMPQPSGPFF